MENRDQTLRELYARYFFSVFDATVQQDDVGRRAAQAQLEESLSLRFGAVRLEGQPGPA